MTNLCPAGWDASLCIHVKQQVSWQTWYFWCLFFSCNVPLWIKPAPPHTYSRAAVVITSSTNTRMECAKHQLTRKPGNQGNIFTLLQSTAWVTVRDLIQSVARDLKLKWMEHGLDHLAALDDAFSGLCKIWDWFMWRWFQIRIHALKDLILSKAAKEMAVGRMWIAQAKS